MKNTIKILSTFGLLGASITTTTNSKNLNNNSNLTHNKIDTYNFADLPKVIGAHEMHNSHQFFIRETNKSSTDTETVNLEFINYREYGFDTLADFWNENDTWHLPNFALESRIGYEPKWKSIVLEFHNGFNYETIKPYFENFEIMTNVNWEDKTKASIYMKLLDNETTGIVVAQFKSIMLNNNESEPVWNRGCTF